MLSKKFSIFIVIQAAWTDDDAMRIILLETSIEIVSICILRLFIQLWIVNAECEQHTHTPSEVIIAESNKSIWSNVMHESKRQTAKSTKHMRLTTNGVPFVVSFYFCSKWLIDQTEFHSIAKRLWHRDEFRYTRECHKLRRTIVETRVWCSVHFTLFGILTISIGFATKILKIKIGSSDEWVVESSMAFKRQPTADSSGIDQMSSQ